MIRTILILALSLLVCYSAESQTKQTIKSKSSSSVDLGPHAIKKIEVSPLQATLISTHSLKKLPQHREVIIHKSSNDNNSTKKNRVSANLDQSTKKDRSVDQSNTIKLISGDSNKKVSSKRHVVVPPLTAKKIDH